MMPSAQAEAWETLVELYRRIEGSWTVVGGQVVYAHCMDRGYTEVRPTMDADAILDVMIPTGLGERALGRKGSKGGTALETPGAQKALNRTRPIEFTWDGLAGGLAPLPSMLGALVAKARAYEVDRKSGRERHLEDFLALASITRPRDLLRDADKCELKTLSSGIGNARNLVRSRGDDAGMDALDALVIMAGLTKPAA